MITWMDFVIDDVCGPLLNVEEEDPIKVCRGTRTHGSPSTSKDAKGSSIQETGQGQRPARMVGRSDTDFTMAQPSNHPTDMEVGRGCQGVNVTQRPRREA